MSSQPRRIFVTRPWFWWMTFGVGACVAMTLAPVVAYFGCGWRVPDWVAAPLFPGLIVSWGMIHGDSGTEGQIIRDMIIFALLINGFAGGLIALTLRAIVAGPAWLRHRRRFRNNQCHSCGYSLIGLTHQRFPECGETQQIPANSASTIRDANAVP